MAGIYVHVPFCRQACSYCDFYFVTRTEWIPAYVDALVAEIVTWKDSRWAEVPIETLYFGGGTPSTLSAGQLNRIVEAIHETFDLRLVEFTFELNPDDAAPTYLADLKSLGVDRLSMGVQTFDPALLRFMHRSHDAAQAERSLENIRGAGFARYNADLIYGNPGQTDLALEDDITRLLHFEPPHVSAYALTIEEETRLGKLHALGRLNPSDDEDVARQALIVQNRLAAAGLERYEVSNYAKPGAEAVHNTNYWRHVPYLGLGPGAHSFWSDAEGAWRWQNARDLKRWVDSPAAARTEPDALDALQRAEEYVLLRLRTRGGLEPQRLASVYGYVLQPRQIRYWEQLQHAGLALPGSLWRLSPEGMNLADRITVDLLTKAEDP